MSQPPITEEEFSDWVKIPVTLQHQFFELARAEAEKIRKRLLEERKKLDELRKHFSFRGVEVDDDWRKMRVVCVDGSDSPVMTEKLGGRFGTFAGGYLVFDGDRIVGEDYLSGYFSEDQLGDPQDAQKILELLRWKLERDLALRCLNDFNPDLVLLDGSFFGYRAKCSLVRNLPIDVGDFKTGGELVDDVTKQTIKLLDSGRAVGVIKRVRTAAIDGWILYTTGKEETCLNRNDRDVLMTLMPLKHYFSYESLLGNPVAYNYFGWYRTVAKEFVGHLAQNTLDEAKRRFELQVNTDLGRGYLSEVKSTARYYIRTSENPPVCFETPQNMPIENIVNYFQAFHNPATGLPFPLDLTDQNVTMPRGFARSFTQEVEALLLREQALDKNRIAGSFANIRPAHESSCLLPLGLPQSSLVLLVVVMALVRFFQGSRDVSPDLRALLFLLLSSKRTLGASPLLYQLASLQVQVQCLQVPRP